MITYQILEDENILIVEPKGPLSDADFDELATDLDHHLIRTGSLNGLLVHTETFPGWNNLSAMSKHIGFIRDHHRKIRKIAIASDSKLADILPPLASHFISAEMKQFAFNEREAAMNWLRSEN